MFSHLRQTHFLKKYLSWLCSIFDFPASSLTWGNVTLKKKKKAIYLQNMCIILLTFFSTQTSLMFNMMWLPQQLELWVSTPSHLSEEHSCDSAGSSQTTDFLYSLEKLSTHRGANTQQLRARENKLLEGCAVGPLRKKTSREKGKKDLMCPRCKL